MSQRMIKATQKQAKKSRMYTIGIDEVGRGPLAGPVAVGAFVVLEPDPIKARKILRTVFKGVKESKQLSEKKREAWFLILEEQRKKGVVDFHVAFQSEKIIDTKGISHAIRTCLEKSLSEVSDTFSLNACQVLLDGGLKAPVHFKNQKTIIKGDAKKAVIALASIVAKVTRDRYMHSIAQRYLKYGFDVHKGYGTDAHRKAILKHGLSPLHRKTFCRKIMAQLQGN